MTDLERYANLSGERKNNCNTVIFSLSAKIGIPFQIKQVNFSIIPKIDKFRQLKIHVFNCDIIIIYIVMLDIVLLLS